LRRDWKPVAKTPEAKRAERGQRVIKAYKKGLLENKTPVVDFTTIGPKPPIIDPASVVDSATVNASTDAKQPFVIVVDTTTHIATAIGNGADVYQIGWWQHSKMDLALCRFLFCIIISQPNFGQILFAA
jgi:hypothetical protein